MSDETKKTSGRPFKMENWVAELKKVLATEDILFLSDKDLQFLVNQNLEEKDRITDRTFENWKGGKFHPDEEIGKEFMSCIHLSLIKQKQEMSRRMLGDDDKNWTRFAWVMERKFTEWNLKHISENINRSEHQTTIQITAANDEQRMLIDKIINVDFEEIKTKGIDESNDNKSEDYDF